MLCVRLILDPFNLAAYSEHKPEALLPFLREQFETWPATARLYRGSIAVANDVTPEREEDVAALTDDGLYYVVVYAGDPVTAIIVSIVAVLALSALIFVLMPKLPTPDNAEMSSNNTLGQRVNKPRPNGRIPDIFGSVISVPELLTVPLLIFDAAADGLEVEYCFMCVGRGDYDISEVKDGATPLDNIAGAGAAFYGPFTSPNSGAPFLSVGTAVTQPLLNVVRQNEVNGQTLRAPNANSLSGKNDIRFVGPDTIEGTGAIDFTDYFEVGDDLIISGANFGGTVAVFNATTQDARFYPDKRIEFDTFDPSTLYAAGQQLVIQNAGYAGQDISGNVIYVDLSGTYTIDTVSSTEIQLL